MAKLGWAALAGLTLVLLTAGCVQLTGPASDARTGDPSPAADAETADQPAEAIVPGSAELALEWTRERWDDADEAAVVNATRTIRAPADVRVAGHESTWLGSAQVFRPGTDSYVPPGTTSVEVTVDWQTQPEGWPLQADLLVGTADDSPTWLNDRHERVDDVTPGEPISLPVSSSAWDDPYQGASLWWFGVDLDGRPASVPLEVDLQVQVVAHREGEMPTTLVAHDPWQGEDRIQLLDGAQRSNDVLVDGPDSSRFYHCPDRCDGLVWAPAAGPLVPEQADVVRARLAWTGDLPSRPVLDWIVEPNASGPMRLVDEGENHRVFETEVPEELADSIWQNRTAWRFEADLETAGQDPDAYSGEMMLTAEAIRSSSEEQSTSLPASPSTTDPGGDGRGPVAGGTAAIAAVGLLLWLASKLRWGAWLSPLYSRIPDDEVLENDRRRRIYEIVKDEPGVHFRQLRRRLDTGAGIVEHHVRKLADANLVEIEATGSHRCFFPKGRFDRAQRQALAGMKANGARRVARAIDQRPGASLSEIAQAVDLAVSTVSHHVQRLEAMDVVDAERVGNAKRLRLTSLGDGILERL